MLQRRHGRRDPNAPPLSATPRLTCRRRPKAYQNLSCFLGTYWRTHGFRARYSLPAWYAARPPPPSPAPTQPAARAWSEIRDETFTLVWQLVYESYFDPTFGGVDGWRCATANAAEAAQATDPAQLRGVLRRMLAELHSSHFAFAPPRCRGVFTRANALALAPSDWRSPGSTNTLSCAGSNPNRRPPRRTFTPEMC